MCVRCLGIGIDNRAGRFLRAALPKEVIRTLAITILTEAAVALGYSIWRSKPIFPVLLTSLFANFATQSLLWIVLDIFFQHYFITLFVAEAIVWMIESVLLYCVRANRLNLGEAAFLSLSMNLTSFLLGWFLPV
jgi:hypothetical protein